MGINWSALRAMSVPPSLKRVMRIKDEPSTINSTSTDQLSLEFVDANLGAPSQGQKLGTPNPTSPQSSFLLHNQKLNLLKSGTGGSVNRK